MEQLSLNDPPVPSSRNGAESPINQCSGVLFLGLTGSGKSTLVGRLCKDYGIISESKMKRYEAITKDLGTTPDFKYVLASMSSDFTALREVEKTKKTSISMWAAIPELHRNLGTKNWHPTFMKTNGTQLCLLDAPGIGRYCKNMLVAAFMSRVVVLLVRADKFAEFKKEMPRSHGDRLNLKDSLKNFGFVARDCGETKGVVVAITNLGESGVDQQKEFEETVAFVKDCLSHSNDVNNVQAVPVDVLKGWNLSQKGERGFSWYQGKTLIDAVVEAVPPVPVTQGKITIFSVSRQFQMEHTTVLMGRVDSGTLKEGDLLHLCPNGNKSFKIVSLRQGLISVDSVPPGSLVTIGLSRTEILPKGATLATDVYHVYPKEALAFLQLHKRACIGYAPTLNVGTARHPTSFSSFVCVRSKNPDTPIEMHVMDKKPLGVSQRVVVALPLPPTAFASISSPQSKIVCRDHGYVVASGSVVQVKHTTNKPQPQPKPRWGSGKSEVKEEPVKAMQLEIDDIFSLPAVACSITYLICYRHAAVSMSGEDLIIQAKHTSTKKELKFKVNKRFLANLIDCEGITPFLFCLKTHATFALLKKLIECGADINLTLKADTPIHIAIEGAQRRDVLEFLLNHGCGVNAQRGDGSIPLHVCARMADTKAALEIVETLMKHNPDTSILDKAGQSALVVAVRESNLYVVEAMLSCGIPPIRIPTVSTRRSFRSNLILLIRGAQYPEHLFTTKIVEQEIYGVLVHLKDQDFAEEFSGVSHTDSSVRSVHEIVTQEGSIHVVSMMLYVRGFTHPDFDPEKSDILLKVEGSLHIWDFFVNYIYSRNVQSILNFVGDLQQRLSLLLEVKKLAATYLPKHETRIDRFITLLRQTSSLDSPFDAKNTFEELGQLFNNSYLSDVQLQCEGQSIFAHRFVLATRSNYFAVMFSSGMKEATQSVITLDATMNYKCLYSMVEYIYTGDTNIHADQVIPLLVASNECQLPHLRSLVEKTLAKNLDLDNAVDLLQYSRMYNAGYLLKACQYYMAVHSLQNQALVFKGLPATELMELKALAQNLKAKEQITWV